MLLPILFGAFGVVISGAGSLSYFMYNNATLCFVCYGAAILLFFLANATRPSPKPQENPIEDHHA
ncbi:MAG: hypothetical protein VX730_07365 [Pseudomonadota bacterium]|nr:hypothetical protein [Pseudomonadota bacterium]